MATTASSAQIVSFPQEHCILFSQGDLDNDNAPGNFLDAVKKYPNVLFTYTANTYASCCLDGEIPA